MYAKITDDFTAEELLKLTIVQLRELFKWYGLSYPRTGKKVDIIGSMFAEAQKEKEEDIQVSVRIRRIRDGNV